jgi:putative oxidoreductase
MKVAMIIVRTLMGLLFVSSSVYYFLIVMGYASAPDMPPGPLTTFNEGLASSGYFMTLLKVTELVCGLLLLSGRFVPLAMVIISPVIINIFLTHLFLAPAGIGPAVFLVLANLFLAYYYWDAFKPLLTSKYTPAR